MRDSAEIADFVVNTRHFIFCLLNFLQLRLELLPNGLIANGNSHTGQHWSVGDGFLALHGAEGTVCKLSPDENMLFRGTLNHTQQKKVLLVPKRRPMETADIRNGLEIRIFGQKRSGHHAIAGWLASQFESKSYFFNDCIPYLDPLRTHTNTQQFIACYQCFAQHASKGRVPPRSMGLTTGKEVAEAEAIRVLFKAQVFFSFEDFDISCYEPHIIPRALVGSSARILNILVLRDPFNYLASLSRGQQIGLQSSDMVERVQLWKRYAREALGITDFLENKIAILYNHWFVERHYRDKIAGYFGITNSDGGLLRIPANGDGSSFDGLSYDGNAQRMAVLNRWEHFRSHDDYRAICADPELRDYSRRLFGRTAPSPPIYGRALLKNWLFQAGRPRHSTKVLTTNPPNVLS